MQKESVTSKTPTLSIQLRKLPTDFFTRKIGDVPIDVGMSFDSVEKILKTPWQELYKKVELHDTKDLMFTLGLNPEDATDRTWVAQKVLLFDIDNANFNDAVKYAEIFSRITGLARNMFSQQWTGGGFHFLISLKTPIETKEFFKEWRVHYQIILEKLNTACKEANLSGTWDPDVFKPNIMSRLPGSINSKYQGEIARVRLIQDSLVQCDFDLARVAGIPKTDPKDSLPQKELAFYKLDTESIKQGCLFLNHAKQNARTLSEPEWYATLTILSKLPDGKTLSHEYSRPHPNYSEQNTNAKLDYIQRANIGPRTCSSISSMWPGCNDCKYYQKVKSPVQIKGDKFIATRDTGFSIVTTNSKGQISAPQYQQKDLMLFFEEEHPFIFVPEMDSVYVFDGKKWEPWHEAELKEYAQLHFKPVVQKENPINEFAKLLYRTNVTKFKEFFDNKNLIGKINLQNGILDVTTGELLPHSKDFGFQNILNFSYDKYAKSLLFEKMIAGICCNDPTLIAILQEWFGYVISGCEPLAQKLFIANGEGENGKSKLFLIIKALLGGSDDVPSDKKRYYVTTLSKINDNFNLIHLQNKDLVVFEEVPKSGQKETWERIKDLCDGGEVSDSFKKKDLVTFKNRAKIMMTCNTLPNGTDPTHGYFRKLLIFPFNANFSDKDGNRDPTIAERVIETELPGVLNWALQGYKRLRDNNWKFSESKAIKDTFEDYKQGADTIGTFLKDWLVPGEQVAMEPDLTCELEDKVWIDIKALYSKFAAEQKDDHSFEYNFRYFNNRLKVHLKKLLGGNWVKVEGSDYRQILMVLDSERKERILATLDRKGTKEARKFVLHGVMIPGTFARPAH